MKEYRIFGPPGCLAADTVINIIRGNRNSGRLYTIEMLYYKFNRLPIPKKFGKNYPWRGDHPLMLLSLQDDESIDRHAVAGIVYSRIKKLYKTTTEHERSIVTTLDHPFATPTGFTELSDLKPGSKVLCRFKNEQTYRYYWPVKDTIVSIKYVGKGPTYDIVMTPPYHNYIAQDFIVHNTGKTRVLARQHIPRAVEKYGRDRVMVTSFTRAAAKEIAGRDIQVDDCNVGTLHSLCFHALGQPELAIKYIKEWNAENPLWELSGSVGNFVDEYDKMNSHGDELLSEIQILKAKMVPESIWKISLRRFKKAWNKFKKDLNVLDFNDLIESAIEQLPIAPNNPAVMFLDEAQDFTPIQFKLIRLWGMSMDWFIMCADDDQTLYGWIGADPEALINPPVSKEFRTVLNQSWRVPAKVLEIANQIISKIKIREPKEYKPRMDDDLNPVQGEVIFHNDNYKSPDSVLDLALECIKQDKSVMFLASCSYMLEPLKYLLRSKGVPFHNPYRRQRYDWNPFFRSRGVSSIKLLSNFLDKSEADNAYWSVPQFLLWAKFLKVGEAGLIKGQGKAALKTLEKAIEDGATGLHTTREVLSDVLSPGAVNAALNRDVNWLQHNLLKTRLNSLTYPLSVLKNYGADTLRKEPRLIIGTIHSVKGGESDCVIVFPDLSRAAFMEIGNEDAIRRMFYVAVTRAFETLILCSPVLPPRGQPAICFEWPGS